MEIQKNRAAGAGSRSASWMDRFENWVITCFAAENRAHLPFRVLRALQLLAVFWLLRLGWSAGRLGLFNFGFDPSPESLFSEYRFFLNARAALIEAMSYQLVVIILCQLSARLLKKGRMVGFWMTLALSVFSLVSGILGFIAGLIGIYSLFNSTAQKLFLREAPIGFRNALSQVGLNFIDE